MNAEQRAALRKLAEEATPGPWWHGECTPPDGHALEWIGQSFVDCEGGQKNYAAPSRDAEYIAAANPQAIRELLDYIETLEKDCARLDWLEQKCAGASDSERYLPFRVYWNQKGIRKTIDAAMQEKRNEH